MERRTRVLKHGSTQMSVYERRDAPGDVCTLHFDTPSEQCSTSLYPLDWHALSDNSLLALADLARMHTATPRKQDGH